VENRHGWAKRCGGRLKVPTHFCVSSGSTRRLDDNEAIEFTRFSDALANVERTYDFLVIDTPGTDNHLTRLAHSMADTLITPINDSYVDFDVLGRVDPTTFAVTGESHYAQMVREARLQRRLVDGARMDWVVMRNRLSLIDSGNKQRISKGLVEMATRIGFRVAEGLAERVVYRELFPRGLTALDDPDDQTLGISPSPSHMAARQEVSALMETIKLPLDERGQERAAALAQWALARKEPLELHDVIAE
jgi:chromosome partitioning protein